MFRRLAGGPSREIFSIHRTSHQELVLSLSGIPLYCLKTKNPPPLLCRFFLLFFHHPSPVVRVFVLSMCVCVCVCVGGGEVREGNRVSTYTYPRVRVWVCL